MHDFQNTMPALPRRMDEKTIALLRAAEGQIDDEHDAARDYESEDGRESVSPAFEGLLSWPSLLAISIVAAVVVAIARS